MLRKLFGYSCQIKNFPGHICDLYWLRNGTKPKFLNVQIIIVTPGAKLPPAEVTSTKFEFALGIYAVALPLWRLTLPSWQRQEIHRDSLAGQKGRPAVVVVPRALSDMGSTGPGRGSAALCTPFPPAAPEINCLCNCSKWPWGTVVWWLPFTKSTVIISVPYDLKGQNMLQ